MSVPKSTNQSPSEEPIPFQNALRVLEEGIVILNAEGFVVYINNAGKNIFEKRLGRSPVVGDIYLNFVQPARKKATKGYIRTALAGDPHVFALQYPQDKKETWFQLGYYPLQNETGHVTHVCVKAQEITETIYLKKKLVREKKAARHKLVKAILEAQEKERLSIGHELHDDVNQVLVTVKLYTEMALSEEGANKVLLQKAVQKLNYCINEIRRLSHQLSSPELTGQELTGLLLELCESLTTTKRIDVRFLTYGVMDKALPAEVKTGLYRIAQEQLANVLKHAKASVVEVTLVATSLNIALKISDNGEGMDPQRASRSRGVGMISMKSRAEALNGTLNIETAPGKGFQLMVEIPLHQP